MFFDVQGLKYDKLFLKHIVFCLLFYTASKFCSLNLRFLLIVTLRSFCCPFFPSPTFSNISKHMVAVTPLILGRGGWVQGHPKILDQNNCGGPEQKIEFFLGGAKFKGGPKILVGGAMNIVGKGGHTFPFLDQPPPPFLEIQDFPTFDRSFRKTKVLINSCNQFVYHFHPQSILVLVKNSCNQFVYFFYRQSILDLEECLQKW